MIPSRFSLKEHGGQIWIESGKGKKVKELHFAHGSDEMDIEEQREFMQFVVKACNSAMGGEKK